MQKIFFLFNWEFTNLCHAMAMELGRRYQKKFEFCGFVVQKKDYEFLKNQREINYTSLGLVPDAYAKYKSEKIDEEYISKLEKEYGKPTLWPYIYADRDLAVYNNKHYSHEDYQKLTQAYFRYITKMLEDAKPDVVVIDVVASMPCYILFAVAKKMGIKVFLFNSARTADLITVAEDPEENLKRVFDRYDELKKQKSFGEKKQDAIDFLKQFREKGVKPEYLVATNKGLKQYFSIVSQVMKIPRIAEYFYQYHFGDYKGDPVFEGRGTTTFLKEKLGQRFRKLYLDRKNIFQQPDYKEQYIFFPLHFEPETAMMIMAPMYIDQVPLIESISKSLPLTYKLYIKEHPVMAALGKRDFSYYERLMKLPNVKLIDPRIDSRELIRNSRLLVTITGTAGWEATILKRPVITFGKVFYNKLDMVKKCKGFAELPHQIRDALDNHKHDEDELIRFLSALFEASFHAKFYEMNGQAYVVKVEDILSHKDFPVVVNFFLKQISA